MTNEQAIKDIHYATNLAKAGQQAPLVGGPIGLSGEFYSPLRFFPTGALSLENWG
jgi:hypothetical protein